MDIDVMMKVSGADLIGNLFMPREANGLVIFSNVNGRKLSESLFVSSELNNRGIATLLFDLLTENEGKDVNKHSDFDLLTDRLVGVTKWSMENEKTKNLMIGYCGTGIPAGAALSAAAYWGGSKIKSVVSVVGRPDLAGDVLDLVESPTLLIVPADDKELIDRNRQAYIHLGCEKKTEMVAGLKQHFVEKEIQGKIAELSTKWFLRHF